MRAKITSNLCRFGLFFCIFHFACEHHQEIKPESLHKQTILPETSTLISPPHERVLVPTDLIEIGEITRQQVELREGPGSEFPLRDQILTVNTLVIPLSSHKIWVKVYIPSRQLEGWIHQQTYQALIDPPVFIELPIDRFPLVFVLRDIHQIFDYESKKSLAFSAPRGHHFRRLAKQGNMVLVYLPETRSIAWLRAGDVQ